MSKFGTKINQNINLFIFLYNGNQINFELTFNDQANSIDKNSNQMKILVYKKECEKFICPKCGEKINLNSEKMDEIILSNNNIKDTINGIKAQLENIVRNSSANLVNIQLNNINIVLNKINEDIKSNNEKLKNLLKENNNISIGRKTPSFTCTRIEQINTLDIYLYPKIQFNDNEKQNALNIMFFGETGCGKTTLINSFVNYLLGVNIIDDYRYKIIQKNINNQDNIYNLRSIEGFPPIKIINAPGFNDNDGIEKKNNKFETIKKLFTENINEINAICFILKSTNNKLTYYQKYVYRRLLDIFGENLKENIIFF